MAETQPIPPAAWMTAPPLAAVVAALAADGTEVRFVGGCVRDSLAGRPIRDVDIATPDAPDRVVEKLETAGLKAVPTGIAHGTVTAVSGGQGFEITTLRRDLETDGRRAKVAFTDDWEADAARRDLTINALSLTPGGRLHDPFGGRADLAAGRVRFVGEAARRMAEDWLRALRFFRFHAHYGRGALDPEGLAAARAALAGVAGLSIERVRNELLRLLEAPAPMASLGAMAEVGLLAVVLPAGFALARCGRLAALERDLRQSPEALPRLAALLVGDAAVLEREGRRLRLSNADTETLGALRRLADSFESPETQGLDRALQRSGTALVRRALLLAAASQEGGPDREPDRGVLAARLARAEAWTPLAFPLRGDDVLRRGVAAGPEVGRILGALEDWWLAAGREPDRAACLAELERRLAERD